MHQTPDLTLHRLEHALMQGDRSAAEELTRRTYRQVYAAILGWCRNPNQAEDLTQETYRKAWQALSTFKGQARFSTWLHRIAYTTFLNAQRQRARQRAMTEQEEADLVHAAASPAQNSQINQRNAHLRSAVEALPSAFRTTVLAHYWNELSVADLAVAEGVTVVAIRKRLAKARRLIHASLNDLADQHPLEAAQ